MKTCRKSTVLLLMYLTLLPVFEAQELNSWTEVTGYLGHEVTLPCQFIPGSPDTKVTQVQWELESSGGEEILILVSNGQLGVSVENTSLKDRVEIADKTNLKIKDVEMGDAGKYICTVSTFPSGVFDGTTNLVVRDRPMPLSSGVVSAIVIAVLLLLVIMAAVVYLVFIRRRDHTVRHCVYIDTDGPVMDAARPSVIVRDEEVLYSDVKLRPSREAAPPSKDKHTETDVTYAEVKVLRHLPK